MAIPIYRSVSTSPIDRGVHHPVFHVLSLHIAFQMPRLEAAVLGLAVVLSGLR